MQTDFPRIEYGLDDDVSQCVRITMKKSGFAPLGLIVMYNSGGAIYRRSEKQHFSLRVCNWEPSKKSGAIRSIF